MSLAIRHSLFGQFLTGHPPAPPTAAVRHEAPRGAPAVRKDPQRRGGSLFHRWAAADLAAHDTSLPLSLNPANR